MFDIKYVITKVSAKNFYLNKNRNYYQYLVENCMKGVSNAVVFEKNNVSQGEMDIMYRTLKNANFGRNVILTPGKTFSLDDLAKVLCYQNEKFSILYNKYFYGFEKEGKSAYFLENAVDSGTYFNYRYPMNEELLPTTIMTAINLPLSELILDKYVRPKYESEVKEADEEKENEQKRVNAMDDLQKRRYDREQRRLKIREEDVKAELLLKEEMELAKMKVAGSTHICCVIASLY